MSAEGERYHPVAVVLHWLTAGLIVIAVPLGAVLHELPRVPSTFTYYNVHKGLGAMVCFVVVARLLWRWRHPAPPSLPGPAWQRRVAAITHVLLYALMLAVPLVGWMASQAGGHPLVWLGLVPLPAPVPVDKALNEALHGVHAVLAWSLTGLVGLHVAAALKHRWIDRDAVLSRMSFGRRPAG